MITWEKSQQQLPVNRHVIDGGTLTIKNTKEDDGGSYICRGDNDLGDVIAAIFVKVTDEGESVKTQPLPFPLPPSKKKTNKQTNKQNNQSLVVMI